MSDKLQQQQLPGGLRPQTQGDAELWREFQRYKFIAEQMKQEQRPEGLKPWQDAVDTGGQYQEAVTTRSPPPQTYDNFWTYLDNLGRQFASINKYDDEFAALMDANLTGLVQASGDPDWLQWAKRGSTAENWSDRYDANLEQERFQNEQFRREQPDMATAAQVAGGIATGIGAGKLLNPTSSVSGAIAQGAALGGGGGAAIGFAGGEGGFGNRLWEGISTGTLGAGIGAAAPILFAGASELSKMIQNRALGSSTLAKRALTGALIEDGVAPEKARQIYEQWQSGGFKPESIIDLGGENTLSLVRNIGGKRGDARTVLRDFLQNRTETQGARMSQDLATRMSDKTNYFETFDNLAQQRRRAAAPLYEASDNYDAGFGPGIVWSPKLEDMLRRPTVRQAWEKAQTNAADEGLSFPTDPKLSREMSTTRVWDQVKQALDDIIEENTDQLTGNMLPSAVRALKTKNEVLGELDKLNPKYKEARQAWAGPSQARSAMEKGKKFLRTDDYFIERDIKKLNEGDREFYRTGVAQAIRERLDNASDTADLSKKLNREGIRKKLRAAFGSDEAYDDFMAQVEREARMFESNRASPRSGSQTQLRQAAEGDEMDRFLPSGAGRGLAKGESPLTAVSQGIVRDLYKMPEEKMRQIDSLIVEMATETDPNRVVQILRSLQKVVKEGPDRTARQIDSYIEGARQGVGVGAAAGQSIQDRRNGFNR